MTLLLVILIYYYLKSITINLYFYWDGIKLNNVGNSGLPIIFLMIGSVVIGATVFDITMSEVPEDSMDETSLAQYTQHIVNETINDLIINFKTPSILGKYYDQGDGQQIEKIAILIKPMMVKSIDLNDLIIELSNNNDVRFLHFSGDSAYLDIYDLFDHPLWDRIQEDTYGIIVIYDKDNSLVNTGILTEENDIVYLGIKLHDGFKLSKGDKISLTFIHPIGNIKIIDLVAPMPIKSVVNFELL